MHAKIFISHSLIRRVLSLFVAGAGVVQLAAAPRPGPDTDTASVTTTLSPDSGHLVVDARGIPAPLPLFFSATIEQNTRVGVDEIIGEARIKIHRLQGKAEVLTLGLSGDGDIIDVSGQGLLDWSVRQIANPPSGSAAPKRVLDLRPLPAVAAASGSQDLDLIVRMRLKKPAIPGEASVLLLTPGDAVGFAAKVILHTDAGIALRMVNAAGLVPFGETETSSTDDRWQFVCSGDARLEVKLFLRGAALADAELLGAQLTGQLAGNSGSINFHLRGQLRVGKAGTHVRVLQGNAALSEKTTGDGWHIALEEFKDGGFAYDLIGDREGTFAIDLPFVAAIRENGDWRTLDFSMPAGAVVPIQLEGLSTDVSFNPESSILPTSTSKGWQGFLPADGAAALAWKKTSEKSGGTLVFTSSEETEVRLGAGLLRQTSQVEFRILQGKLGHVRCRLDGPGEIIGVEGANVVGWKVIPGHDKSGRVLEVNFSRPIETAGSLVVRSQTELGGFPVRAEPLRVVPEGVVRHSGFLRIANSGAVRLEVADTTGMMQLAPAQFPGSAAEQGVRQVFVYRFPSANYDYRLLASQIQPEVGVSAITTYDLAETDRAINANIELDVREAALRDWSLQIPADYTVAAVTGGDVSDYVTESETAGGYRALKVLFSRAIEGRQLLQLRLEKNQAAAAGDWTLPALRYPGAKTVRGHIGVVATPGYRVTPTKTDQLVEVPLSYFPRQTPGLQQAWRLRDADWTAVLRIEALGQSIQADAFHLYSVKQGVVYGSVLLNYFVVGAPANEWRIEVPAAVGNIDVVGQNVRRDWRREGNQVIVSLHQPVLGPATLLVTFEQPMSARGGTITPGEVRPLGVQSERGYIEVVSPLQVKHAIKNAEGGLLRLESLELPAEFRLLTTSPALAVYQYTARPFKLEMSLDWYTPGETVDQVVDFAKLSSQVSRDGQVVTDVHYFVKTRGQKALRLVIPAGMKLWETRVDGEMTNARVDGDQTIIPLPARLNANEPVSVTLRLGQAAGGAGSIVKLIAPRTIAPTVIDEWTLRSDSGYLLVPRGGNAQEIHPALRETGFEWVTLRRRAPMAVLLGLAVLSALLLRTAYGWKVAVGLFCGTAAICAALLNARDAVNFQRPNLPELTYAATMVPAGENVVIELANVRDWRAMLA